MKITLNHDLATWVVIWEAIRSVTIIALAALLCVLLIAALRPLLARYALARPNARSSHKIPTPQGGGIAVVITTIVTVCIVLLWSGVVAAPHPLPVVFAAVILIAGVGAADDIRSIPVIPRLLLQALAVALVIYTLPNEVRVAPFVPWWAERILFVIGGVWFVNLVNFMDGLDWMTVAEVVPVTAALAVVGWLGALPSLAIVVTLALCGAMIGFAFFNRPVARLFLGDVGSLPIGLLLGWLLLVMATGGHLAGGDHTAAVLSRRRDHHLASPCRPPRAGLAGAPHAFLSTGDRSRLFRHAGRRASLCREHRARRPGNPDRCRTGPAHLCRGAGCRRDPRDRPPLRVHAGQAVVKVGSLLRRIAAAAGTQAAAPWKSGTASRSTR